MNILEVMVWMLTGLAAVMLLVWAVKEWWLER